MNYDDYYLVILEPNQYETLGKRVRVGDFVYDDTTIPDKPCYVREVTGQEYKELIGRVKGERKLARRLRAVAKIQGLDV